MDNESRNPATTRRDFIKRSCGCAALVSLGGLSAAAARRCQGVDTVWQIDPYKCVQCGKCRTECVIDPSAVKCMHAYTVCGYCDLCFGFFQPEAKTRHSGAENQLCPTAAIIRTFIEEPYYQYKINEDLCVGCGKCVKGCSTFGNGSFYLQIMQHLCLNCNECAIARACPADAITRVPASEPYVKKGK